MFNITFIKVPVSDGRNIVVNYVRVDAIEDLGETIKVSFGGKWLELNMTLQQFIDKCNEKVDAGD